MCDGTLSTGSLTSRARTKCSQWSRRGLRSSLLFERLPAARPPAALWSIGATDQSTDATATCRLVDSSEIRNRRLHVNSMDDEFAFDIVNDYDLEIPTSQGRRCSEIVIVYEEGRLLEVLDR